MIRKLLVFALLLGAGLAALWIAVGGEEFARVQADGPQQKPVDTPAPATSAHMQGSGMPIAVELRGRFEYCRDHDVKDDRGTRPVRIYELRAKDSQPVGDGLQRLLGVTLKLFDRGQPAADLVADEAMVALANDKNGQPSVREDKEIELRKAVVTTLPGGRLGPLRLDLAVVVVHVRDSGIELHTPSRDDPVHLEVTGDRPVVLDGKGLLGRLPKDGTDRLQQIDLEILQDVALTAGFTVHSDGAMHYVEATGAGTALLSLTRNVRASFQEPGGAAGTMTATGDRLAGWLLRPLGERRGLQTGGRVDFRLLRLDGAPAHVEGRGIDLTCARVTVVPGLDGQPYLFSGAGAEPRLVQDTGDQHGEFKASRRIHLVHPGAHLGPQLAAFGFPRASLGALADAEIAVFEGQAEADAQPGVLVQAHDGMLVSRPDPKSPTAAVLLRGLGKVHLEQREAGTVLVADGNDGCLLQRLATGDRLRLGPDTTAAARQHAYHITRDGTELQGTGTCRFDRDADGQVTVNLLGEEPTIALRFGDRPGELHAARRLSAVLRDRELRAVEADGDQVVATYRHGAELLQAKGPRLRQEDAVTWRLEGDPGNEASFERTAPGAGREADRVQVTGPLVRVVRIGESSAVFLADRRADRRVHVDAAFTPKGQDRVDLGLDADHARLQPFALPPMLLRAYLPMAAPLAATAGLGLAEPWVFADGDVVFQAVEPGHGTASGAAASVVLAQGSQSALLLGDADRALPAVLSRTETDGRVATVKGPRVQLLRSAGEVVRVLTTFPGVTATMLPELTLQDPRRTGRSGALANLRGSCGGEIELLPDVVLFHGPVHAHSCRGDGSDDPDGLQIDARQLQIYRDVKTGEPIAADARNDVVLDWNGMHARARTLHLDILRHEVTVDDPDHADLVLPNGMRVRARGIKADYESYDFTVWRGSLRQSEPPAKEPAR